MYDVSPGDKFTNAFEVNSGSAVVIEALAGFIDKEDDCVYYVLKCRENGNAGHAWYYEDEVVFLDAGFLYKYFERVETDGV